MILPLRRRHRRMFAVIGVLLPLAFMAGVLWWRCIELIGTRFGGPAWLALMSTGTFTGVVAFAASIHGLETVAGPKLKRPRHNDRMPKKKESK